MQREGFHQILGSLPLQQQQQQQSLGFSSQSIRRSTNAAERNMNCLFVLGNKTLDVFSLVCLQSCTSHYQAFLNYKSYQIEVEKVLTLYLKGEFGNPCPK